LLLPLSFEPPGQRLFQTLLVDAFDVPATELELVGPRPRFQLGVLALQLSERLDTRFATGEIEKQEVVELPEQVLIGAKQLLADEVQVMRRRPEFRQERDRELGQFLADRDKRVNRFHTGLKPAGVA
jgi:hypothetical protein